MFITIWLALSKNDFCRRQLYALFKYILKFLLNLKQNTIFLKRFSKIN